MSHHPDPFVQHVHSVIAAWLTPEAISKDGTGVVLRMMNEMYQHSLCNTFNAAANPHHFQHAAEIASRYRLQGVSGDYLLPRGLSAPVLETYAMVAANIIYRKNDQTLALHYLNDLITRLEELNPALTTLTYNRSNIKHCHDAVLGVTSGFNTDDIQFYLDGNYYKKSMENPAYAAKHGAVVTHLNDDRLYWVPSPKTLDRILAQKPSTPPRQP